MKSLVYLPYCIILFAILLFLNVIYEFNILNEVIVVYIYELFLFLSFVLIFTISITVSSLVSVYSLFLITSFVFNYGRFFLELITSYHFNVTDLFHHVEILSSEKIELLQLIISYLLFSFLAFVIFYKGKTLKLEFDSRKYNAARLIMLVILAPLTYNYIIELKYIVTNGYLSLFTGEMRTNTNSILPAILPRIMMFAYFLLLSAMPSKDQFIKYSLLFMAVLFVDALKGQRGEFLLTMIFMVWFYCNFYSRKLNYKLIVFLFLFTLVFSEAISSIRKGDNISFNGIINAPFTFIESNGLSVNIPLYLIKYEKELESKSVPYFFAPINDYFYRVFVDRDVYYRGPSSELLEVSNYLSFHVINFVNTDSYYQGYGTGTSYLAELYDLGKKFIGGICLFFIVMMILKLEKLAGSRRYILFLSPIIIPNFIYMPRGSFLKFIDNAIPLTIMYFLFHILLKLSERYR